MKNMLKSNLFISSINCDDHKSSTAKGYSLSSDDVIIYSIYLPDYNELTKDLVHFLNPDERSRSERYYQDKDRNQFIICRAILKFVLAAYTQLDVTTIHIDYLFNKKPYLSSHPWLCFNISHSENFAVIAISLKKVGVDIENISKDFTFTNLLPDIFDNNEVLAIQKAANKKHAFYKSWTRKEALVKALGKGIDDDFKNIPSLDGHHIMDSNLIKNTENWQVYSFELANQYFGAVAFESLSTMSKNLVLYSIPKSMKALIEMAKH
jgi:4'-phosphopantetheinyl transferase